MTIGIVLVTYNTGVVLLECLESIWAAAQVPGAPEMRVLVVDNSSREPTLKHLRVWAADKAGAFSGKNEAPLFQKGARTSSIDIDARDFNSEGYHETLATVANNTVGFLQAGSNGGFAAGINHGLRTFREMSEVEYFWLLNSDAMTEPDTPKALVANASSIEAGGGNFGILGGRTFLTNPPEVIQSDGGRIGKWTGRLLPFNLGQKGRGVPGPDSGALEYLTGCHMLVSRIFIEKVGLMPEDYFLYFEEVDWCLRRGDFSLHWVPDAAVHHRNGSSIGSEGWNKGPSPLSAYWMYRNRLRFIWRWYPIGLPTAFVYSVLKIIQLIKRGHYPAAKAALRGILNRAAPSA